MKLYTKLFAIQGKVSVTKDGINPHFKSKYMTLDNIVETMNQYLIENKLLVTHFIDNGTLTTRVVDIETAEILDSHFPMNATDPQKIGSEISYGKRYNLVALFNICADEDDDGNDCSNNAPTSNETPKSGTTTPKTYPKNRGDEIMAQMDICEDIEQLKTLFEELLQLAKTEPQAKFYTSVKDKNKKRIGSKDIHAVANGIFN